MSHGYIDTSPGSWEWRQVYKESSQTRQEEMDKELISYNKLIEKQKKKYKGWSIMAIDMDMIINGEGVPGAVAEIIDRCWLKQK